MEQQLRLFEPKFLFNPDYLSEPIDPQALERVTLWGERGREGADESVARGGASCLDYKHHNSSYISKERNTSLNDRVQSDVEICVEGSAVKVNIRKIVHRQEKIPRIEEYFIREGHPEDRELLFEDEINKRRAKRGRITKFSKSSSRRLRWKLSSLKTTEDPLFAGLTFPDDFPTPREAHRLLKIFFERLLRAFPGVGIAWKLEMKPRLSGENRGRLAPHFHLLVYGITEHSDAFKKWAKRAWFQIVGSGDRWHKRHGCSVKRVYDLRGIKAYLRKYFSKEFEYEAAEGIGRTWGFVGEIPWGEVRKYIVDTKVAYAFLRACRNKEKAFRKELDKRSATYRYRPPGRGLRTFNTGCPAQYETLLFQLESNQAPF